jgi:hypothetical protein
MSVREFVGHTSSSAVEGERLTPLPTKKVFPLPSPFRRGLGRGGKGLGVRFLGIA